MGFGSGLGLRGGFSLAIMCLEAEGSSVNICCLSLHSSLALFLFLEITLAFQFNYHHLDYLPIGL